MISVALGACGNSAPASAPATTPAATATVEPAASEVPPVPDEPAPAAAAGAAAAAPADDPQTALATSKKMGRGAVLVFCAQWAVPCRELDHTFADATVKKTLEEKFVTAHVDMTDDDAVDVAKHKKTFKVKGLPTILVYDRKGKEVAREMSLVDASALLALLAKVK